jgi:Cys-tRNA(Pro) deacylase
MGTIITKVFDNHGIKYIIKKHKKSVFTCEEAAQERNVRISQILKCMLGKDADGNTYVMLIPGNKMLKIKKMRQILNGIRVELIPSRELFDTFGVIVGAISPIQFLGKAKYFLDKTALLEEIVDISSGLPDAGIELKIYDLISLLNPMICDIISSPS